MFHQELKTTTPLSFSTPDGGDVSSGVENDNGVGKSREKIREFVMAAKVI